MRYKRIIYPVVFILALIVFGYFVFTGCQISEQNEEKEIVFSEVNTS